MTAAALTGLWLNEAVDPSQSRNFLFMSLLQVTPAQQARVAAYAGGRVRLITTPGQPRAVSITLQACSTDDRAWLEARVGVVLWVRDDRGRRLTAAYSSVQVAEHAYDDECDITLTLNEITFSDVA